MFPELVEPEDPGVGNVAWAAGLFEGEGCITWGSGPRLLVANSDRWVLDKFRRVVGVGKIYGPYEYKLADGFRRKPKYIWQLEGWRRCQYVMDLFWPWLSPRRRARAEEILIKRIYSIPKRRA